MMDKLELSKDRAGTYTLKIVDNGAVVLFKEKVSFRRALRIIRKYEKENDSK